MRHLLLLLLSACSAWTDPGPPIELVGVEHLGCGQLEITLKMHDTPHAVVSLDERVVWTGSAKQDVPVVVAAALAPGDLGTLKVIGPGGVTLGDVIGAPDGDELLRVRSSPDTPMSWRAEVPESCVGLTPARSLRVLVAAEPPDDHEVTSTTIDGSVAELPPGEHQLEITLRAGKVVLETASLPWSVAPPCPDVDGDGVCDAPAARFDDKIDDAVDRDGDGFEDENAGGLDCDDTNPEVSPGRPERAEPNGIDDNCNGIIDEGTVAYDDDGDGKAEREGDCDDTDKAVYPGAPERPNCRDDDCDGEVDEGVTLAQVDDAYESNDTKDDAHRLATQGQVRHFHDLEIVSRSTDDEEWFRFYSDDGIFDEWRIIVNGKHLGVDTQYEVVVHDDEGARRGSAMLSGSDGQVRVTGRAFQPDSGIYYLQVRPVRLPQPWCPATIRLESW